MRLLDVAREFQNDDECLDYIEARRWPNGVCCIHCGSVKVSKITRATASKNKRTRLYQCLEHECGKQFSTTSGTIFDGTHLPLPIWFKALSLILEAKKGMSAKQVARHLDMDLSYKTIWYLCHRIRKAMKEESTEPLTGVVEIDETYVGGKVKRRGQNRRQWRKRKEVVVGLIERKGKLRFFHVPAATRAAIKPVIDATISTDVQTVMTDESVIYPFAMDRNLNKKHKTINHSQTYGIGDRHTNTIENAFSLLKRGILGSYHKVSLKHLNRYCSEFEYRFNRRDEQDAMFSETITRLSHGQKLPFKTLIG